MATSPIPPMLIELQLETAKIQGQMTALQNNFASFGKTVEKQGSFLEKFKATATGVFAGNVLTTGLTALKGAIGGAIADAQLYEQTIAKTNAVIASTGNVAGISATGLKQQASALENISAVDENVILNGENVIATFTQIRNAAGKGNDIFNQTTKAALDLSVALGQDMQSSAIQLGKALNDPIKGVSALQRVGVTFDAQQKQMIKTMTDSGNVLGAQKVILAEVNREFGGAAKASGDTFAGAIFRAKDAVQDFGRDLVTGLQPILLSIGKIIGDIYDKSLKPLFSWISKNKEAVGLFVGILVAAYAAFKAYAFIMGVVEAATTLYTVATALMAGAQLSDVAATEAQTGAMTLLNAVMNANPIALVVLALAALAAGFVVAWNHSEAFRKVIVEGMKGAVMAVGYLIKMIGWLAETFLKIESGPLRLFLKGLSFLHVTGAKTALDEINKGIASVGGFFDKAGNAVQDYADKLDNLKNKKIELPSFGGNTTKTNATKLGLDPTAVTADNIKAAAAAQKQKEADIKKANAAVVKLYKEMNTVIDQGAKTVAEATAAHEKEIAKIEAKYADQAVKIEEKKNAELVANKKKWDAAYKKAYDTNEAEVTKITDTYEKQRTAIAEKYATAQAQAHFDANQKILDAQKKAVADQAAITQQSVDRLRSAFASGTAASVTDIFKAAEGNADTMLSLLKDKLTAAKTLQTNAAKLAAAGYSQVFIEDVVKNGPEVGNQMATALLNASDDTKKQLQDLYSQVDNISNHGVDQLASTMNQGGKLATEELMKAYNQVPVDLAATMQEINTGLITELARAQGEYNQSLADAATTRDAAIADAKSKLNDALDAADQALAEANTQTMTDFNDALAKNAADLADALAQEQKDYEDKIQAINDATKAALADLRTQLLAVIDTLKSLGQAQAAATAAAQSPAATYQAPVVNPTYTRTGAMNDTVHEGIANGNISITVPQTFVSTGVDPTAVAQATMSGIKYGQAIVTPRSLSATSSRAFSDK